MNEEVKSHREGGCQQVEVGVESCVAAAFRWREPAQAQHVQVPGVSTLAPRFTMQQSQRHRITGERMNRLADRWLPALRILHPYPEQRLRVTTRVRSPVR